METPTTTPESTPTTNTPKSVTYNGTTIAIDLSSPIGILRGALALDTLTPEQRTAYDLMVAGALPEETIANLISAGFAKDLKAKIKDLEKPDHDAAWRAMSIEFGESTYTVGDLIAMRESINLALNRSSDAYNKAHEAKIAPFVTEGGTSRRRAKSESTTSHDRSYVKLGSALLESGITAIQFNANGKAHTLSLRKAEKPDPTNGATVEYKSGKAWVNVGTLRAALVAAYPAGANIPNAWDTFKVKDGESTMTIGAWYDANMTEAEKESA